MADLLLPIPGGNDDLYTETIKENLKNRVLIFNDEVNDNLIENYILHIFKWNREDKDIDPSKKKENYTDFKFSRRRLYGWFWRNG